MDENMDENMNMDVLAIGAHPDDVELGVGGLVHKLTSRGYRVAILDLTRGEMGTRGTAEERAEEAKAAAAILGVKARFNAGLPDGAVENTPEQRRAIVPFIRMTRPALLLATMRGDRHPDHSAAHALAKDANYLSGLAKLEMGHEPHRAPYALFFHPYAEDSGTPAMIVDIADHINVKMAALEAHASQFHNPAYEGRETFISSKGFWDSIRTRAAYWGGRIKTTHGEALYADGPVAIDLPPGLRTAT